jgi:hypothetical protein
LLRDEMPKRLLNSLDMNRTILDFENSITGYKIDRKHIFANDHDRNIILGI